ncbi:MAG: DUF1963 domain-containing protein [Ruminococcus sp.]|nr:DUF1963 domain-containing protein [Ruminococcus sp.]
MDFKGFLKKFKDDASKAINETIDEIQHEFSNQGQKPANTATAPSAAPAEQVQAAPGTPAPVSVSAPENASQASAESAEGKNENAELKDPRYIRATVVETLAFIKMKTCKSCVKVKLVENTPGLFESKVGGLPYIPADGDIPCDENGGALRMLAQIDCSQIKIIPDFPETGLLQFWIAQDSAWGLDTKNGSKVIWYENVDHSVTEEQVREIIDSIPKPDDYDDEWPVEGEFGLEFIDAGDFMPACNSSFAPFFTEEYNSRNSEIAIEHPDDLGDDIGEMIWEEMDSSGNKIGGYPGFTQNDPRSADDDRTVLLLQLDSQCEDGESHMMWGDMGMCVFLCTPEELRARDFSNVLYHWDCG